MHIGRRAPCHEFVPHALAAPWFTTTSEEVR